MLVIKSFLSLLSIENPNIWYVTIGIILLTSSAALVGSFTFLQKKSLIGDAIAHAVLPGICLAFMFSGTKHTGLLLLGASFTGFLSLICIDSIITYSKIKEDTAIAIILSVFFGVGTLLLTHIQHNGNPEQTGLNNFLLGKAAALLQNDIYIFAVISVLIFSVIVYHFRSFVLIAFDRNFAQSIGMPIQYFDFILIFLLVLAITIGIQAVGVVLMAAMLITPAAAARFWTYKIKKMIFLAVIFSIFAGICGTVISYAYPAMPTGPWIVLAISFFALFSFLFAPSKGIFAKNMKKYRFKKKNILENTLKIFYHLGEKDKNFFAKRSFDMLKKKTTTQQLHCGLKQLKKKKWVKNTVENGSHFWLLTAQGKAMGKKIVRRHRLWELYLTTYLNIKPDHIHDDAESIEHIINDDMEKKLLQLLKNPEKDPHQSSIP